MSTYIDLPLSGASPYWGNAVATAASLPLSGSAVGQAILVLDTESLYYWDGAAWIQLLDGLADVSGPASSTDNSLALFDGITGKLLKSAAAITATRALESDASGVPVASATTSTELGYVSGVTSAIQTQLNGKEPTITILPISKGGTNSSTALVNNRVFQSSGGAIVEAAAITASRALVSDTNGIPTHATTTTTEIDYVSGVTSAIQTQLNGKEPTITVLPIAKGGTNSSTALLNNRVLQSSSGSLVEAAAITASRALISDANGIPTHSATTSTELGYVSGVTSAIQTQIDGKVTGPGSATDNALVRYDSTTGKLVQNSGATLDDSNNLEGLARINASTAKVGGTGAAATSAVMELSGTTGALLLTRLTTAEITALTGVNGMIVYNSTTDRFQGYFAGSWADLHGWGS